MEYTIIYYRSGEIKGVFLGQPETYAEKHGLTVHYGRGEGGAFNKGGEFHGSFIVTGSTE